MTFKRIFTIAVVIIALIIVGFSYCFFPRAKGLFKEEQVWKSLDGTINYQGLYGTINVNNEQHEFMVVVPPGEYEFLISINNVYFEEDGSIGGDIIADVNVIANFGILYIAQVTDAEQIFETGDMFIFVRDFKQ